MASRHEHIVNQLILKWTDEKRGRLYKMKQGLAIPIYTDNPVWFGPLNRKFKGFPDLFGFEHKNFYVYDKKAYSFKDIRVPIYCVIEVKTEGDRVRPDQEKYLDYVLSAGGIAYLARETDSGYSIEEWWNVDTKQKIGHN